MILINPNRSSSIIRDQQLEFACDLPLLIFSFSFYLFFIKEKEKGEIVDK